jgi:hypothetical protein
MKPVDNGIPQGSPVSPILAAFKFYSSELLEKFTIPPEPPIRDFTPSQPSPVNIIMYVDDGKIYVSSTSLQTNVILLKLAYSEVEAWLKSAGLAPDLAKREIMHYSRRKKYDCSPPISLLDYDGVTRTLVPDRFVKWLGLHFDRKLRFHHHAKIAAAKGEAAVNALSMLANTVHGLSQTLLRRLYLACVIPKILYACPSWWNNTKVQEKPLVKVQRKALYLICAAFKTTPPPMPSRSRHQFPLSNTKPISYQDAMQSASTNSHQQAPSSNVSRTNGVTTKNPHFLLQSQPQSRDLNPSPPSRNSPISQNTTTRE